MKTQKQIEALVQSELDRAKTIHPQFSSAYEGYAVLLVKVQELNGENEEISSSLESVWRDIKADNLGDCSINELLDIRQCALDAAYTAVKVAALAQTFACSLEEWVDE